MTQSGKVVEFPAERSLEAQRRQAVPESPGPVNSCDLLPIYMRNVRTFARTDRQREIELGREIQQSIDSLLKLFKHVHLKEGVGLLDGAAARDDRRWSLFELERVYRRFVIHVRNNPQPGLRATLRRAQRNRKRAEAARSALINANLRLVVHIAMPYAGNGVPLLDLVQEGNIGLLRAAELFEWSRGHRFGTYAYHWIRQAVSRAALSKAALIHVPLHVTAERKAVSRASGRFEREHDREPTAEEIAETLECPTAKVRNVLSLVREPASLDSLTVDGHSILPILEDCNAPSPLAQVELNELRRTVRQALQKLPPKEAEVLERRFGIGGHDPHTLDQVGRRLDLSRERVRQIQSAAMARLQQSKVMAELRVNAGVA